MDRKEYTDNLFRQYQVTLDERDREIERADALDDAIREALDVCSGWFGMAWTIRGRRRLRLVKLILLEAIAKHGVQNRKENES